MPFKDYISWTTIIAAYNQTSHCVEAFEFFREVHRVGMKAGPMMIGSKLLACNSFEGLTLLKKIHGYAIRYSLLDLVIKNTIIDIYGECKKVNHALKFFELMMDVKYVVSWTSMINCYVCNGFSNEALSLSLEMMKANVKPDAISLVIILAATSCLPSLMKCKEVHSFAIRRELTTNGLICNPLVDMYARCGNIDTSFKIFNMLKTKDLVHWTTMINACGLHEKGKKALQLFKTMEDMGLVPDHITFLALLYTCSHSGLNHEGRYYFEKMIEW